MSLHDDPMSSKNEKPLSVGLLLCEQLNLLLNSLHK